LLRSDIVQSSERAPSYLLAEKKFLLTGTSWHIGGTEIKKKGAVHLGPPLAAV
jgi:hypothetical protein